MNYNFMEGKEKFLRKLVNPLIDVFYKMNISAQFLTIFRLVFGLITIYFVAFGQKYSPLLFVLIYQFVMLLDFVDGGVARKKEDFRENWSYLDFFTHYILSILMISAISVRIFWDSGDFNFMLLGFFAGFLLLLNSLAKKEYYLLTKKGFLSQESKTPKEHNLLIRTIYSFIRVEEPFGFVFIFVVLQFFFYPEIDFYKIFVGAYFTIVFLSLIRRFKNSFNSIGKD